MYAITVFLYTRQLGCDERGNCDSAGYVRLDGECGCVTPIILSELHEVRLEYANTATKPGRLIYFEGEHENFFSRYVMPSMLPPYFSRYCTPHFISY